MADGEPMKMTLLRRVLVVAGAAHGQGVQSLSGTLKGAGSMNNASDLGSGSAGLNGAGSINGGSASAPAAPASAPGAAADRA